MPRLVNSVPKYRYHRGSKQAVVTLNGREFYLGPHGTKASRIEYDRLISEWLVQGRHSLVDCVDRLTIAEAINRYRAHVEHYYVKNGKPTSEQTCIRLAVAYARQLYGNTPADEFSPIAFKAVRQQMLEAGLSRSTINKNTGRIRRMFKWLAAEALIPTPVYHGLLVVDGLRKGRSTARESKPVRPIDSSIVEATLPYLPCVVADMVRLQRLTGMRPAELCIMRPRDFDRTGEVWRYLPESHKTEHHERERVVFFGPQAQLIVLSYLNGDADSYCFRPVDSEAKRRAARRARRRTPLHFGNSAGTNRKRHPTWRPGEHYTAASYRRAIHRACDKAFPVPEEIKQSPNALAKWQSDHRWSPNQLRHSAATEIRRRFGLEAAQVVLGHSQANVTQVYAERDYALAARVAKEVG